MAEDKVIKSGQITLPRLLFFAAAIFVTWLLVGYGLINIGYILLTAVLCVLLFFVAIDYGVKMDEVKFQAQQAQGPLAVEAPKEVISTSVGEPRVKRRSSRPTKRRR